MLWNLYEKKNGSNKILRKVYEFKTYNKDKNEDKKRKILDNNKNDMIIDEIAPIMKKLKLYIEIKCKTALF